MQDNKILNLIIPVVAVIIIFESVMLVSNLSDKTTNTKVASVPSEKVEVTPVPEINACDLIFVTETKDMKIGKSYKVELNLMANKDFFADGVETYIKYDPKLVTVSALVSGSELPKANLTKIDSQNGIIKNIILVDDSKGYQMIKNGSTQVLSFNVTPKKTGLIELEISSGNADKQFATIIVENATSKSLTFSSNKLKINATK